jgi:phosphate transport system permease protein
MLQSLKRNSVSLQRQRLTPSSAGEKLFQTLCVSAAMFLLVVLGSILAALLVGGWPAFAQFGIGFIWHTQWNENLQLYGAGIPVLGTIITASLALLMAWPLAIGISVFLNEFCPKILASPIAIMVDLLAGIPSIVYGIWGFFVFSPFFFQYIQHPIALYFDPNSLCQQGMSMAESGCQSTMGQAFAGANGSNILTASIVLAIMILPYMASVFRELLSAVPAQIRESAYGLGCTPFETVRKVLIPSIGRGMVGGTMLGLGRALGETMAVTYIIGNDLSNAPSSLFSPSATIASTIANLFAEASGIKQSALIALGLILFLLTFVVLACARMLINSQSNSGASTSHFMPVMKLSALWTYLCAGVGAGYSALHIALRIEPLKNAVLSSPKRRLVKNSVFTSLCYIATFIALAALAFIFVSLLGKGLAGLSLDIFTHDSVSVDGHIGLLDGIIGSLFMCFLGMVFALVIGILAGTWLAEYAQNNQLGNVVRFLNDVLLSAPSILMGMVVYVYALQVTSFFNSPQYTYTALSGALVLGLMATPIVVRTTEDMLLMQPSALRESGVALGASLGKAIRSIIWRAARTGLITGGLLAFARISGETAPLLFTALGNNEHMGAGCATATNAMECVNILKDSVVGKTSALPLLINYFKSLPGDDSVGFAWTGALLISVAVLSANIIGRVLDRGVRKNV